MLSWRGVGPIARGGLNLLTQPRFKCFLEAKIAYLGTAVY